MWHAISFHANGTYETMFDMVADGNTFLPVVYNLGLIAILSATLGLLMGTISDLMESVRKPSGEKGKGSHKK